MTANLPRRSNLGLEKGPRGRLYDDVPVVLGSTKFLKTEGVLVNAGLQTKRIEFAAFDVVFQEKTVKGSLIAGIAKVKECSRQSTSLELVRTSRRYPWIKRRNCHRCTWILTSKDD